MVGSKVGLQPAKEQPEGKLSRFAMAGAGRKFVGAEARIEGKGLDLKMKNRKK